MEVQTDELVSLRELSRRTGLSMHELRRLRDEDRMPVYRFPHRRRQLVCLAEFRAWVRTHSIHLAKAN